jgi:hypothetical protein
VVVERPAAAPEGSQVASGAEPERRD